MSELQQQILDCLADLELTGKRFVELQSSASITSMGQAKFQIGVILHNEFALRHVGGKHFVCVADIKRNELPGYERSSRDGDIVRDLQETGSLTTVGSKHGLTRERVRQIAGEYGVNAMAERRRINEAHRFAILEDKTRRKNPLTRFLRNVIKSDACWEWIGSVTPSGYGHLNYGRRHEYAHRVSWRLHKGIITKGLFVLHTCDNRSCVNPDHLYLGTQQDNVNDRTARGRHRLGERLTPQEVIRMRHMHFEESVPISTIAKETRRGFDTVKRALRGGNKGFLEATEPEGAIQ